jgi:hypothetical protein
MEEVDRLWTYGLSANWEILPTSAWNYAIEETSALRRGEGPISAVPFSSKSPPVTVTVDARTLPGWELSTQRCLREWGNEVIDAHPLRRGETSDYSFPTVKT